MELNRASYWMGRPITELSRDELLEVIEHCGREIVHLRKEAVEWRDAADPIKYLKNRVA